MNALTQSMLVACSVTLLTAAGCAQQSPAQAQAGVDQAAAEGARDMATVRNDANNRVEDAQRDLTRKEDDVRRAAADGDRRLTIAESEATHRVALEHCGFQTGDARAACQTRADDALSAAKASVEASKTADLPRG
jgi:hypothetical protein